MDNSKQALTFTQILQHHAQQHNRTKSFIHKHSHVFCFNIMCIIIQYTHSKPLQHTAHVQHHAQSYTIRQMIQHNEK